MELVRRIIGAYLALIGIFVAVLFAVTPLYHDGSGNYMAWQITSFFMAVSVVIILIVGVMRKRAIKESEVNTITHLRTSFMFYGGIVLASLFFWQWFWLFFPANEPETVAEVHFFAYPLMDILFPVLSLVTGIRVWKSANEN